MTTTAADADKPSGDESHAGPNPPQSDVQIALRTWRDGLINLTGTNRALNFRHTKTGSIAIWSPELSGVFEGLRKGVEWDFEGEPDDPNSDPQVGDEQQRLANPRAAVLRCRKPEKELGTVLRSLARRANQEFLDRGLSVMYVALGMLQWQDVDRTPYASPLLLLPVELIPMGQKNKPRLKLNRDSDPVLNPALALRLADFGVTLPILDDLADVTMESVLDQVRAAIGGRTGWKVTNETVLSPFSFQKEAMYRDLLANEAAITAHPLVKALANQDPTSQDVSLLFDEISPEHIDRDAPPEVTQLILDADSSQRACVAAAVAGRSFVMDGPPGTGKSQTIANMIGALLHAGKTVLFVSEKAAALEVVRNRLAAVGLQNYLLELHSHKASRKEVAAQLARALDTVPIPPPGMGTPERRRAAEKRELLTAYAAAMNRVRWPLGDTLHRVLGQIATLDHVPAAPTPPTPGGGLSQQLVTEMADAAARLRRAWRPAVQGRSFLWRQVTDRSSLDTRLYTAENALEELVGTAAHNSAVIDAFALESLGDLQKLVELLQLASRMPAGLHDDWLTTEDFAEVRSTSSALEACLVAVSDADSHAEALAGVPWSALPDPDTLPGRPSLEHLSPPGIGLSVLAAGEARELSDRFAADATMLEQRLSAVSSLASTLRMPPVKTVQDVDALLALADAAFVAHRPEWSWLSPEGLGLARAAASALRARVSDLDQAEAAARRLYTDAALAQPLADLHERFTSVHRGLRKLFGAYRRDKQTVAAFTTEMVSLQDAIDDLGLAVTWSTAVASFVAEETAVSPILGRYWQGRNTDFKALDEALSVADDVLRRCPVSLLPAVADHVSAPPDPALKAVIDQTREDLAAWKLSLVSGSPHVSRPELSLGSLLDAVHWLRSHLGPLEDVATVAQAVSDATGRTLSYGDSLSLLAARRAASDARDALVQSGPTFTAVLGETLYRGTDTDILVLNRALDWAWEVRQVRYGMDAPLTTEQLKSLSSARTTERLQPALLRWTQATHAIAEAFAPERRVELHRELDDQGSAESLLADLRSDTTGQEEWIAYARARTDLVRHGLGDVVQFCVDQQVGAEVVVQVVQRAVLRSWADATIAADPDLQPQRAPDRDALIDEFRDLDRQLVSAAVGDIIRSVNARRPASTDVGEPAVIRREGVKKTRHMSVRDLIRKTRTTTMALKPCFMMSPLAVSQYLPPDMHFDVVIFDEASQVTPGDAINCVYRGTALITAGDDKQLPPTSFFDRMTDEEEETETDVKDFQSILELSKASGGFRNLGLRWHYRSRHESLIAFSNQRFYEGKLVTFPGAHSEGPDVGVEMVHVPGVYRRGTSRDNAIEASHVARRVVHHFDTRPDTSLGVVTFSVAQADAIQAALERELEERPDLAGHLDSDRLHGFFIKSLESVQGDERDVMIFSIGYGPDENGKITSNFGALNKARGWRRLNVAITRARQRVEIVTSLRAGDVPDSVNESVRHLRGYLDYAERGFTALALDLAASGRDTDSPFEDSVIDAIRAMGFIAEPQVGAAGYRIDIGVRHPAHAGVYALGVECDGYMYHSSPAARDRDRLRQQVLEGLGWRLHRIWGTAWHRDRGAETNRLRSAIEDAVNAPVIGRLSGRSDQFERAVIELAEVDRDAPPTWVRPYIVTRVPALPRWGDPSDRDSVLDMVVGIETLARDEGPVHLDLVFERLRSAWRIGRIGSIVRENIFSAIRQADVTFTADFLDVPVQRDVAVRVPARGDGYRTAAQVPEIEFRHALFNLVQDAGAVTQEDLFTASARLFGWNRRGPDINSRLSWVLGRMRENGDVIVRGETVRLSET